MADYFVRVAQWQREGGEESHLAHNQEETSSIPVPATSALVEEQMMLYGGALIKMTPEGPVLVDMNIFREAGSRGGKRRAEKLSKERRSEIAQMGGLAKGKK